MARSTNKKPTLSVGTAVSKANTTAARLDALVPTLSSDLSPTLIYLPGADIEIAKPGDSLTSADYGWVCPDGIDEAQVECFGPGGGAGGGGVTGVGGGGGAGGGEYACEPNYPLIPGETYSYFAAPGGKGGKSSAAGAVSIPGFNGMSTHFDFRGKGIDGGVLAHGGQGGDQAAPGVGGAGGTGSANTVHFDGGRGSSSSGTALTDNPVFGLTGGINHVALWYRLDDVTGSTNAFDYGQNLYPSVGLIKNSGAVVAPTREVTAPPQVPFGPGSNWFGDSVPSEVQGNCWKFSHGTGSGFIGGIVARSFTLAGLTGFSASAWIRGLPTAASASDWTDGTHSSAVIIGNKDVNVPNGAGWALYLNSASGGAPLLNFTGTQANGSVATITGPGPAANDGNWHMVTVSYTPAANHFILYVDGVAVTTATAGISSIGGGSEPITVGLNKTTQSFGFKGYMSNVWVASQEAPSSYVAAAFGTAPAVNGGGGGASGGSAGAGHPGTGITGGTAAAATQPGINNGSGAGGAGGASGSNGNTAPHSVPYAGGGGGAGVKATVSSAFSVTLPCAMSASYAGLDAQGANDGALYTVSADPTASESNPWYSTSAKQDAICYSGGTADAPFKGSMNSILTFPSLAAVNGSGTSLKDYLNSGDWALQKAYLQLTVETTAACNLVIGLWQSNAVVNALDSDATLTAFGYPGAMQVVHVDAGDAGRQVTIDVSTTALLTALVNLAQSNGYSLNGSALAGTGLLVGTLQGSPTLAGNVHGAWNADEAPDWYCAFHGADASDPTLSAQLRLSYTAAAPSLNTAGDGAPGYIVISFIDPKGTPVSTVLPAATTDAGGHALGAGYTAYGAGTHAGATVQVYTTPAGEPVVAAGGTTVIDSTGAYAGPSAAIGSAGQFTVDSGGGIHSPSIHTTANAQFDGTLTSGSAGQFTVSAAGNVVASQVVAGGISTSASVGGTTFRGTGNAQFDGTLVIGGAASFNGGAGVTVAQNIIVGTTVTATQVVAGGITTASSLGGVNLRLTGSALIDGTVTANQVVAGGISTSASIGGTTLHCTGSGQFDTTLQSGSSGQFSVTTGGNVTANQVVAGGISTGASLGGTTIRGTSNAQFDGTLTSGSSSQFTVSTAGQITTSAGIHCGGAGLFDTTLTSGTAGVFTVSAVGAIHGASLTTSGDISVGNKILGTFSMPTTAPAGFPIVGSPTTAALGTVMNNMNNALNAAGIW